MINKNKHNKTKNKYFNITLFAPLIALIVLFITLGYSAFQSTGMVKDAAATVRPETFVRVTNLEVDTTSNATVISKDYTSVGHTNGYITSIYSQVTFTRSTSSVKYAIDVTNFGNVEMGLASITGLPNNLDYELDTNVYDIGEKICNSNNECTLGAKKTIYVTIKYKSGSGTNTSTTLNANFNLTFKELHNIYYNSTAIDYVIDGGNKTVSLGNNPPTYIRVTGTLTNSSYTSPNVTLTAVTSDIYIIEVHKVYVDNVVQQNTVDNGGNITVNLGNNAPTNSSDITITGSYGSSSYNNPNLILNNVTTDIYITIGSAPVPITISEKIESVIEGITPDSNGMYTGAAGSGCTNKIIDDGTSDHNLRYVGSDPCNYVTFNGETWRIIGVFYNMGSDPLVKLVNGTAPYSTSVKFNNNNKNGGNVWGSNSLSSSMQSISAASNSMVQSVQWRIGGPQYNSNTAASFYSSETSKTSSSVSIGLINAADFGYATDNISSCRSSNLGSWTVANCVTDHNWLYLDNYNSFTVTTVGTGNSIYRVTTGKVIVSTTINTNSAARAALYLKADILYDSGDGSSGTPYTLKTS
ncbi:MAG: hypothetical protein IJL74_04660 [Bacilli bacterium]|nr:hypothetical protein [Bacilli bacterium]